jgi:high-affinity nickel-transport protein
VTETFGNLVSLLFLGFLFGIRHATDPDHVVAIATIVSRQRNLRGSAMIGAVWGLGHTLTILAVGGAIILFGVVIPPRLGLAMEFIRFDGEAPRRRAHSADGIEAMELFGSPPTARIRTYLAALHEAEKPGN